MPSCCSVIQSSCSTNTVASAWCAVNDWRTAAAETHMQASKHTPSGAGVTTRKQDVLLFVSRPTQPLRCVPRPVYAAIGPLLHHRGNAADACSNWANQHGRCRGCYCLAAVRRSSGMFPIGGQLQATDTDDLQIQMFCPAVWEPLPAQRTAASQCTQGGRSRCQRSVPFSAGWPSRGPARCWRLPSAASSCVLAPAMQAASPCHGVTHGSGNNSAGACAVSRGARADWDSHTRLCAMGVAWFPTVTCTYTHVQTASPRLLAAQAHRW